MTPEKQVIAIAESVGYEMIHLRHLVPNGPAMGLDYQDYFGELRGCLILIPNYLNSLDAIQAAVLEKGKIDIDFGFLFNTEIYKLTLNRRKHFHELTAADWCEAYLKAIGEWEES